MQCKYAWLAICGVACSNVNVVDDDGAGGSSKPSDPTTSTATGGGGAESTGGASSTAGASAAGGASATGGTNATGGSGEVVCTDGPDLCDGVDSDCDGEIDEDDPVSGTICETGLIGPCNAGTWSCETGFPTCIADAAPEPEFCDFLDNDCNGMPDDGLSCAPKRVFVSSQLYMGNLGGVAGADETCQQLADAAGLGGEYKAWLSSPSEDARDRLTHASYPYVRVDGVVVADSWSDLVDGTLDQPINVTELGGTPPNGTACADMMASVGARVWTGTLASGELHAADQTCISWASEQTTGTVGCSNMNSAWSVCCSAPPCLATAAIYCFEQ